MSVPWTYVDRDGSNIKISPKFIGENKKGVIVRVQDEKGHSKSLFVKENVFDSLIRFIQETKNTL